MSIKQKHEQMLYTGVLVSRKDGGHGSGVVIGAKNGITVVLTCKHVVKGKTKLRVKTYPDEVERPAKVLLRSSTHDLAILTFEGEHPYVASLSGVVEPKVYEKVWSVGAGNAHDPYPGTGIIASVDDTDESMVIDTETVYGDSGGPVFVKEDGEYCLAGIVYAVHLLDKDTPVYHQGIAHTLLAIHLLFAELNTL